MGLTKAQKIAIREIAEQVISGSRPSEMILVKHLDVDKLRSGSGGMLGFDLGASAHVVLPHLAALLVTLADAGAEEYAKKWGERLAVWIFREKEPQMLDASCLQKVGEAFRLKLVQEGRSEQESARISDALISTLVSHPSLLRKLVGKAN
jgi:hypothetical protein